MFKVFVCEHSNQCAIQYWTKSNNIQKIKARRFYTKTVKALYGNQLDILTPSLVETYPNFTKKE